MDAFKQVNVYFNYGIFFLQFMFISVGKYATVEI